MEPYKKTRLRPLRFLEKIKKMNLISNDISTNISNNSSFLPMSPDNVLAENTPPPYDLFKGVKPVRRSFKPYSMPRKKLVPAISPAISASVPIAKKYEEILQLVPPIPKKYEEILQSVPPIETSRKPRHSNRGRKVLSNQPRQRSSTSAKDSQFEMNNLSNIACEMKKIFEIMPQISAALNNTTLNQNLDKSTASRSRLTKQRTRKSSSKESSRFIANEYSKESSRFIANEKSQESLNSYLEPISKKNTSRPGSSIVTQRRSKDISISSRRDPAAKKELNYLKDYFVQFHMKSKNLLSELERKVLGKNSICTITDV